MNNEILTSIVLGKRSGRKQFAVLIDPDKVEIEVRSARQKVKGFDPIAIRDGKIARVTTYYNLTDWMMQVAG